MWYPPSSLCVYFLNVKLPTAISSNVGNVPELMANIDGFRPVNSFESLVSSIKKHGNNLNLNSFGEKIYRSALSSWTWEKRSKNFIKLF